MRKIDEIHNFPTCLLTKMVIREASEQDCIINILTIFTELYRGVRNIHSNIENALMKGWWSFIKHI